MFGSEHTPNGKAATIHTGGVTEGVLGCQDAIFCCRPDQRKTLLQAEGDFP